MASETEILIEKTPEIVSGNYTMLRNRALCMKKVNPNVKLLAMLCDPVKRFISHAKHTRGGSNATVRDQATVKYVREQVKWLMLDQHKSYLLKEKIKPNSTHLLRPNATEFAYGPFKKARVTSNSTQPSFMSDTLKGSWVAPFTLHAIWKLPSTIIAIYRSFWD